MNPKELQEKIDLKTKPIASLGKLEALALQIGSIQNTLTPTLSQPTIVVFAGDHGIAKEGVSAYPQEVTHQMVLNFLNRGAAINVFCKQHQLDLKVVDAGVNHDFGSHSELIDAKVNFGTRNFLHEKAMTKQEMEMCFEKGAAIVNITWKNNCNIIGFGEMGIGNTSAASMLMSAVCKLPLEQCVGRGTGLDTTQLAHKLHILSQAQAHHQNVTDPYDLLQTFGGFEIVQMCSAMLFAQTKNMVIMVDGFIATTAYLMAFTINPEIKKNSIFCHLSDESGHRKLLNFLDAEPLLALNMRLGEGSGCAVAYPIIKSAVAFVNEMASFDSAGVSNK